jgi:hypothetical protein
MFFIVYPDVDVTAEAAHGNDVGARLQLHRRNFDKSRVQQFEVSGPHGRSLNGKEGETARRVPESLRLTFDDSLPFEP